LTAWPARTPCRPGAAAGVGRPRGPHRPRPTRRGRRPRPRTRVSPRQPGPGWQDACGERAQGGTGPAGRHRSGAWPRGTRPAGGGVAGVCAARATFGKELLKQLLLGDLRMDLIILIGRVLFVVLFLNSGVGHLRNADAMAGYAKSRNVPAARAAVVVSGVMLL